MAMATSGPGDAPQETYFYAKGKDPAFHGAPSNADLMQMVLALTSEVSVLRERLDTHERVNGAGGTADKDGIENFEASDEVLADRQAMRQRLIAKVLKPIKVSAAKAAERLAGQSS